MTVDMSMVLGILAIMFLLSCVKPFLAFFMGRKKKLPVQAPIRIFGLIFGILVAFFVYPQVALPQSILLGIIFAAITDGTYAHFLSKIRIQMDEGQKALSGQLPIKRVKPPASATVSGKAAVIVDQPPNDVSDVQVRSER